MFVFPKASNESFPSCSCCQHWKRLPGCWQNLSVWKVITLVKLERKFNASWGSLLRSDVSLFTVISKHWGLHISNSNVQTLPFSLPPDFPTVPTCYLLLEVRRRFGRVGKEKELHQTANVWPFSAEHSFIRQLGTRLWAGTPEWSWVLQSRGAAKDFAPWLGYLHPAPSHAHHSRLNTYLSR